MTSGIGYITSIIMLYYLRIHPLPTELLSLLPAGFEEGSCLLWTAHGEPCDEELRWPLQAEDSLWLTASKNLGSSQSYNCREINSADDLWEFGSTFFLSGASRWKRSPANTFSAAWKDSKVETPTQLCPDSWCTETEIINVCCLKLLSLWDLLHRNRKLIQILGPRSGVLLYQIPKNVLELSSQWKLEGQWQA